LSAGGALQRSRLNRLKIVHLTDESGAPSAIRGMPNEALLYREH
jgi:hypothetical protein